MQRIPCDERADWQAKAEEAGFRFHTVDGERYWDERAYYAFTLEEIERDIEAPTAELDAMCRDLVARAVDDEKILRRLAIGALLDLHRGELEAPRPEPLWPLRPFVQWQGPAKLLEYNADTPTSVFETAVFQWMWLEDAKARHITPRTPDQYNSLHERLIEGWKESGRPRAATCTSRARSASPRTTARSPIWRTPRSRPG